MINKEAIKRQIKDLPFNLGAASLAIIMGIGNDFFKTTEFILSGKKLSADKAFNKAMSGRNFRDYYEEIRSLKENSLKTALWRLEKKRLIKRNKNNFILTFLGLKYFAKIREMEIKREQWDGKWRILMFDIPEKFKKERVWLRRELYGLEYKSLQKSVFIGKFPIPEDLFKEFIRRRLRNYINLITVGEIDKDEF